MMVVLALSSCAGMNSGRNNVTSGGPGIGIDTATVNAIERAMAMDSIKTDSVSFSKTEGVYKVILTADYPVAGGDSVVKAVREFINDFTGNVYDGPLDDGLQLMNKNGEWQFSNLQERSGEVDPDEVNELFIYKDVTKTYETELLVSFSANASEYVGGIHGIGYEMGLTFSKLTGQRFGYEMMQNTETPAFKRLIKEGLKQFFGPEGHEQDMSDEDLLQELVSFGGSIDELPLPDSDPYMTEKGIRFIYQPYEISYYAAGKPEFTIPYETVKPFLTPSALNLFLSPKSTQG